MPIKRKCPSCEKSVSEKVTKFPTGIKSVETGKELVLSAKAYSCKKCGYSWMSASEAEKVEEQITKATWQTLKPVEIAEIREAMGFKTKVQAAKFLGLNAKAFTRWEKGYNPSNFSVDLLLRLAAHSEANMQFIRDLHSKNFKYEKCDYETVCKEAGQEWQYKKASQLDYAKLQNNELFVSVQVDPAIELRTPVIRQELMESDNYVSQH